MRMGMAAATATARRTTRRRRWRFPLIILAIGSILAGYVGIPHALGGHNRIEGFLEPVFEVHRTVGTGEATAAAEAAAPAAAEASPVALAGQGEAGHATGAVPGDIATERMLMAISTGIALAGIGIAFVFWYQRAGGAGGDRPAVQRRAPAAAEQVLPRRDLQRGHRPADQAGVDRRPVEGRRRRA